jgi:predicted DNA-binding protein (MmcQ/YjbR family)
MAHSDRERSETELDMIRHVEQICATLPEVDIIIDGFGHTTFKVAKKSFVLVGGGHAGQGEGGSISIKSDPITQEALVRQGPYVRTPYIGQHGWVTVFGSSPIDWEEVTELINDAFNIVAPKRLRR